MDRTTIKKLYEQPAPIRYIMEEAVQRVGRGEDSYAVIADTDNWLWDNSQREFFRIFLYEWMINNRRAKKALCLD